MEKKGGKQREKMREKEREREIKKIMDARKLIKMINQ